MDARRAAQFLDFNLFGMFASASTTAAASVQARTVFISYARANQDLSCRVEAFFSERGFSVWRNERTLPNSTVDVVISAIAQCKFFVCLISRAYHCSANCRAEFELAKAHKRQLVPIVAEPSFNFSNTWLGFLPDDSLYYTIVPDFDSTMARLVAKEIDGTAQARRVSKRRSGAPSAAAPAKTTTAPATKEAVRAWLQSADLGHIYPVLEREGFAEQRFAKLRGLEPPALSTMFGFTNAEAVDLWDALKRAGW